MIEGCFGGGGGRLVGVGNSWFTFDGESVNYKVKAIM